MRTNPTQSCAAAVPLHGDRGAQLDQSTIGTAQPLAEPVTYYLEADALDTEPDSTDLSWLDGWDVPPGPWLDDTLQLLDPHGVALAPAAKSSSSDREAPRTTPPQPPAPLHSCGLGLRPTQPAFLQPALLVPSQSLPTHPSPLPQLAAAPMTARTQLVLQTAPGQQAPPPPPLHLPAMSSLQTQPPAQQVVHPRQPILHTFSDKVRAALLLRYWQLSVQMQQKMRQVAKGQDAGPQLAMAIDLRGARPGAAAATGAVGGSPFTTQGWRPEQTTAGAAPQAAALPLCRAQPQQPQQRVSTMAPAGTQLPGGSRCVGGANLPPLAAGSAQPALPAHSPCSTSPSPHQASHGAAKGSCPSPAPAPPFLILHPNATARSSASPPLLALRFTASLAASHGTGEQLPGDAQPQVASGCTNLPDKKVLQQKRENSPCESSAKRARIMALQQHNSELRTELHRLQGLLQPWATQGFVTQEQVMKYLAQAR